MHKTYNTSKNNPPPTQGTVGITKTAWWMSWNPHPWGRITGLIPTQNKMKCPTPTLEAKLLIPPKASKLKRIPNSWGNFLQQNPTYTFPKSPLSLSTGSGGYFDALHLVHHYITCSCLSVYTHRYIYMMVFGNVAGNHLCGERAAGLDKLVGRNWMDNIRHDSGV